MGMTALEVVKQDERRRLIAGLYIRRIPKKEIAVFANCSKQTVTRDVKWLKERWNKELIKDPVAHRARTLASMQEIEKQAASRYLATNSIGWWRCWLEAVEAITRFLGLDSPIKVDTHLDGDLRFTFMFETPDGRIVDAERWAVMQLETEEDEG